MNFIGSQLGPIIFHVPISAAEGLHLVPMSLKIWSSLGPDFEKYFELHTDCVSETSLYDIIKGLKELKKKLA